MRDRYRTGELFSRSEDSIVWLGDEGSNAVQRCGWGTSVWNIPINIAFVDVGLIGVTVYSRLGKSRECPWLLVYLHGHGASQAGAGL